MCAQAFLLCAFGQDLIDSSLAVSDAVFESDWNNFEDVKLKKSLMMIMIRAQKPMRLTAMNFVTIRE